jgi:hypothetical protein
LSDNVISYIEMCRRERTSLQAGMNFGLGGNHSVILMLLRANAPYRDRLEDSGTILNYEGHDQPKGADCANPKVVDQPDHYPSGSLTQNGKFHEAAQRFKSGQRDPERVRVYEKIRAGIWSNDHDLPVKRRNVYYRRECSTSLRTTQFGKKRSNRMSY